MAGRDWVGLVSSGLSAFDRTYRLLETWSRSSGGGQPAKSAAGSHRPRDTGEALQIAHRVLDALENKPQRRGWFW